MCTKILILIFVLVQTTACVIIPDTHVNETLTFDSPAPSQAPVSYADLMCCYDCAV